MAILGTHEAIHDLTNEQLRMGCMWLKTCGERFCPNMNRFRFKCFGLIDPQHAYDAYCQKSDNYVIQETVRRIPNSDFSRLSDDNLRKRFRFVYNEVCTFILNGGIIETPKPKLTDQTQYYANLPKSTPEVADEYIAKMKKTLRGRS
jgi:hypothetical protein